MTDGWIANVPNEYVPYDLVRLQGEVQEDTRSGGREKEVEHGPSEDAAGRRRRKIRTG